MNKTVKRVDTNYHGPDTDDGWVAFTPVAAVLVTCVDKEGHPNIIPLVGWGVLGRFPFTIGIAVCHSQFTKNYFPRYSHKLLEETPEFVLNIPHAGMRDAISVCGSCSGNILNKFEEAHLTPRPSLVVKPPVIAECPVNLECVVRQVVNVGSHDVYLGEVVVVHSALKETVTDEDLMNMTIDAEPGDPGKHLAWRSLPWWLPEAEGNLANCPTKRKESL